MRRPLFSLALLLLVSSAGCRSSQKERQSRISITIPHTLQIDWVYTSVPRDTTTFPNHKSGDKKTKSGDKSPKSGDKVCSVPEPLGERLLAVIYTRPTHNPERS